MTQALRILRKDFDYLRIEIAAFILFAAGFAWTKMHIANDDWSEPVLALAAAYLAARAVHADRIPGDRQFWLTRPYNRGSLIIAKLLFVVLFVSLPVSIAEVAVGLHAGFSVGEIIPRLLLSQTVLFALGALPIVALASVTTGMIPFILVVLMLTLIFMGGASALEFWLPSNYYAIPGSVEWIRSTLFAIPIATVTAIVLLWQYRSRATNSSRILAVAGVNVAALIFIFMPASFALWAQSRLSKSPNLASEITVSARPSTRFTNAMTRVADRRDRIIDMMSVPMELLVDHLPANVEVRADNVVVEASWNGLPLKFGRDPGINKRGEENGRAIFDVSMIMSPAQFRAGYANSMTIKGSLYLTVFGDDRTSQISLHAPNATTDDLHCRDGRLTDRARVLPPPPGSTEGVPVAADSIVCTALFDWPHKLVYAEAGGHQAEFSNTRISYAPLPTGFTLMPVETRWSDPLDSEEITIRTRKPLAHFRRDFELTDVKLMDFERVPFLFFWHQSGLDRR